MIKFVYFDVGGVLIKDFSKTDKWERMKKDLQITDPNFDIWFDKLEMQLCLGKATFEGTMLNLNDFVSRFEVNKSIWPAVKMVKKKYKIGLVTGMYPGMLDAIKTKGLLPNVNWDVVIDSSVVGMKKPDKNIFELAQKEAGVKTEEILFVENSSKNIDTAKSLGWQTFLYDSGDYEKSSQELLKFIGVK